MVGKQQGREIREMGGKGRAEERSDERKGGEKVRRAIRT